MEKHLNVERRVSVILAASAAAVALSLGCVGAQAALITNGFTFSVASDGGNQDSGSHFHSNTGGAFGNPAGKAEVGRFFGEEVRGLSEYTLSGLNASGSAFFTMNVYRQGGLFAGANNTPFSGRILVDAYVGNNLEDISDYQAASLGNVGSFVVNGPGLNPAIGDVFSFDITSIFNSAIAAGDTSLGIRLRADRGNVDYAASEAWTFQDFRLTSDNQTTHPAPEPGSMALALLALGGMTAVAKARRS